MTIGIVVRKRGMTRIFTEDGRSVPVTVVEASVNKVTRLINPEDDGYRAVQVAWGSKRRNLINKPLSGVLSKADMESAAGIVEFRLNDGEGDELTSGAEIKVDIFAAGQKVSG